MINRKHKDRLFKIIFGRKEHKDWILSLYNAINGTSYTDADAIEINTMDDVLYMGMRNDVSFLFHWEMNIFEHQSTYNPNMPLRLLMYLGRLYEKYIKSIRRNMFYESRVQIPLPRFVVFYNGVKEAPDETILELKDLFPTGIDPDTADITVRVRMINVNAGHNRKLLEACRPLGEYAWFEDRIRTYSKESEVETAVDRAIREMPDDYLIKPLLVANKAEVKMSLLTEYNEAEVMEMVFRDGKEEGRVQGREEGREEGRQEGRQEGMLATLRELFDKGLLSLEDAANQAGLSPEGFLEKRAQGS